MNFKPYSLKKLAVNSSKPMPRSGHRIVADDSYLYSYGGYNPNNRIPDENGHVGPVLCELWRYHFYTDTWDLISTEGPKPKEAASHSMLLDCKNVLLVYGGTGQPFGHVLNNTLSAYNIKTNTWSIVNTKGNAPEQRYGQALAVYNNDLYVSGGTDGYFYSLDLFKLDLQTKEWTRLSDPPVDIPGRYRHEIAIYEDKIYVIGGATSAAAFSLTEIPVYDITTDKWTLLEINSDAQHEAPSSRQMNSAVQKDNFVYISGGYDTVEGPVEGVIITQVFDDIWKLDLRTMRWIRLPTKLQHSVFFHTASLSPDGAKMYIFGGTNIKRKRVNSLYSVWVTIPKLEELVWSSLNDNTKCTKIQKWRDYGLINKFVQRIDKT